ncbi:helix-turn-helix-type transcriptional regulator [Pseudomonas sp. WN033]|nr:helix-turn-helix-type transcriptional regulator [Pseudomonas sp. WN033]
MFWTGDEYYHANLPGTVARCGPDTFNRSGCSAKCYSVCAVVQYWYNLINAVFRLSQHRLPADNRQHANMTDDSANTEGCPLERLEQEELYPIREVSRLTGVNSVTLRAWERRYGLLIPHRTDSGHRLYSMADIERVRAITAWIKRGVTVSKVASVIDRQPLPEPAATADAEPLPAALRIWRERLHAALAGFDVRQLESVYGQIMASFPLAVAFADVLLPVWRIWRERSQSTGPACWALLDGFLRSRLFQRIAYHSPEAPSVLLINLPGPQQELEVLLAAALIADADAAPVSLFEPVGLASLAGQIPADGHAAVLLYADQPLEGGVLTTLRRLEQSLECPLALVGDACQQQSAALSKQGVVLLGELDQGLTWRLRALLGGRLDQP